MTEIPSAFLDILTDKKALAHLATLQPDGSPQVTPVWFDFTNGVVRVKHCEGAGEGQEPVGRFKGGAIDRRPGQ